MVSTFSTNGECGCLLFEPLILSDTADFRLL